MRVYIDTETTGIDCNEDELLQIAACDEHGNELFCTYVCPEHHKAWSRAEAINGISPEMVALAPCAREAVLELQKIIDCADSIAIYNADFDIPFLVTAGLSLPESSQWIDTMIEFAEAWGEKSNRHSGLQHQKLTNAARWVGYGDYKAHDALDDARATAAVQRWLDSRKGFVKWLTVLQYENDINRLREAVCDGIKTFVQRSMSKDLCAADARLIQRACELCEQEKTYKKPCDKPLDSLPTLDDMDYALSRPTKNKTDFSVLIKARGMKGFLAGYAALPFKCLHESAIDGNVNLTADEMREKADLARWFWEQGSYCSPMFNLACFKAIKRSLANGVEAFEIEFNPLSHLG